MNALDAIEMVMEFGPPSVGSLITVGVAVGAAAIGVLHEAEVDKKIYEAVAPVFKDIGAFFERVFTPNHGRR